MGVVFRARDTLLERDVAVKVLAQTGLGTEGRARLLHEARAAAQLNHPNIVGIYDAGKDVSSESSGQPVSFIVMELVEHRTLFDHKPDSLDEILSIARQICDALEHAHSHGVVHRDLKPENVIVADDGTVKLTDFGLARSVASRVSTEGAVVGTVFYLPPEQALGQEIDGRADLYALGAMLYEMTTQRLPFTADDPLAVISQHLYAPVIPPSTYNAENPPGLDALIVRLLSKKPQDRPASAAEVRHTLDHLTATKDREFLPGLDQRRQLSPLDQLVRGRLVGREREFAEAKALWKQTVTAAGEQNVLLISGEPGVGKTPLVRELMALSQVSGGRALTGDCYAEGGAPYAPVTQIIRDALPLLEHDLPDLVLAGLIALAPDLQVRYPDVPPNPPLAPQAEQQRLFEAVVALFAALADRNPLLLVVEDVQWADGGTLFLLRHLARRSRSSGIRLLIVMTYREMELDQACCLGDVLFDLTRERLAARIKLTRLSREQTRDLLAVMFQEDVSDDFLEGIYRETQGNPFFIEEISKALIEDGKLYREADGWHRPDINQVRLPQSVRMAIQSRVDKLPTQTQDVLRLAAIVGREFDFDTLHLAGQMDEDTLIDALETAERMQLIDEVKRNGRETFAFAHGLTMATLRESVSGLRRRRLHRRVVSAIEDLRPDDLEALAYHCVEAGDEASALTYTLQAADRARRVYANDDAIRLYTEALDLMSEDHPGRFDAFAARCQVFDIVARREEQRSDVEAMLALAEELDDDARRCDAYIALADYYMETEPFRTQKPAQRAVAIAQRLADPVREGHALRRVGFDAWQRGDLAQSRDALEAAAASFQKTGLLSEAAICLHTLSLTMTNQGENAAALESAEQALALSRQAGDRRQEATSLRRLAIAYMKVLQHAEALPHAETALALHRELGDRSEECNGLNVVGIIFAWLERPDKAKGFLDQSLALAEEIGFSLGISNAIDNLMWVHYEWQGEFEAGLFFLDQWLDRVRSAGDAFLSLRLQFTRAETLTRLGQHGPASELLQTALSMVDDVMGKTGQRKYLLFQSVLWAHLGEFDRARQQLDTLLERAETNIETAMVLLNWAYVVALEDSETRVRQALGYAERAVALLKESDLVSELAESLAVAAWFRLLLGDVGEALKHSAEAVQRAARLPIEPESVLFVHSRVLRAAGQVTEANEHLRRAYQRVMLVANKTQDETLRQGWLENVWINREILADCAALGMSE
jgi:tetratricopeptide (TPR) repeat protein